MPDMSNMMV